MYLSKKNSVSKATGKTTVFQTLNAKTKSFKQDKYLIKN